MEKQLQFFVLGDYFSTSARLPKGPLGCFLGTSWGLFGCSWVALGVLLGCFWDTWGVLEVPLGRLGSLLGCSWSALGGFLGRPWGLPVDILASRFSLPSALAPPLLFPLFSPFPLLSFLSSDPGQSSLDTIIIQPSANERTPEQTMKASTQQNL